MNKNNNSYHYGLKKTCSVECRKVLRSQQPSPMKGVPSKYKGVKLSDETKKRMSLAQTGRKHSEETKKKLSEINKGKKTGVPAWNKGLTGLVGDRNPNWKGGLTRINNSIRHLFEYRQWRDDVFTRDGFTCQNCGEKGYVQAHHIKSLSEIIQENNIKTTEEAKNCAEIWNINNGITLCCPCHKETDSYGVKVIKQDV